MEIKLEYLDTIPNTYNLVLNGAWHCSTIGLYFIYLLGVTAIATRWLTLTLTSPCPVWARMRGWWAASKRAWWPPPLRPTGSRFIISKSHLVSDRRSPSRDRSMSISTPREMFNFVPVDVDIPCLSFWLRLEAQGVTLSVRLSGPKFSRAVNLHHFSSDSLRTCQDDFRITLREHSETIQRAFREQESNQISSYCRSLKYFVLLCLFLHVCNNKYSSADAKS